MGSALMFLFAPLHAGKVDVEKAEKVALGLVRSQDQLRSGKSVDLKLVYTAASQTGLRNSKASPEAVYYYVFNVGENDGFVMVSGDDATAPVLGYGKGGYDPDNLPPNMAYWIDYLQREIAYAVENNLPQSEETKATWNAYLTGNAASLRSVQAVLPLIQTRWNQYGPYNDLCPSIGGTKTVTGCVATAMAQIMKYYNYPTSGTGSSDPYTTNSMSIDIPSVDFNVNYDWNNMTNTYDGTSTAEQNAAVATLMYHCGVSVGMDYNLATNGGSAASSIAAGKAWMTYFGYDQSVQGKQRVYYDDEEWNGMLKNEIDAGRPVFYSGSDVNEAGHAFVCDGYDNTGLFHFNWGWGGLHDGYFASNMLNPGIDGAGSGSGVYNTNQGIILNIMPNQNGIKSYEMKLKSKTSLSSPATSVDRGESFTVEATYANAGVTDFSGLYGIVLVDDNDEIIEPIGSYNAQELPAGYSFSAAFTVTCAVSSDVSPGNYKIRAAVKPTDGDWIVIEGDALSTDILPLEVENGIVADNSKLVMYNYYRPEDPGLTVTSSTTKKGEPFSVIAGLWNQGSAFIGELDLGLYSPSTGELAQLIDKTNISIEQNYVAEATFSTSALTVAGTYKLALYAKAATGERKLVSNYRSYLNNIDITIEPEIFSSLNNVSVSSFTLYPNPVKDVLSVSGEESIIQSVKITDLSGRTVKSVLCKMKQVDIPVNDLTPGYYLVTVQTGNNVITEKIIKN